MSTKDKDEKLPAIRKRIFSEKEELLKDVKKYKDVITKQVGVAVGEVKENGKHALVVSGIFLGVYGLLYLLIKNSRDDEDEEEERVKEQQQVYYIPNNGAPYVAPKKESAIIKMIKAHIAQFLLSLAKKELVKVLEHFKGKLYENVD